MDSDLLPRPSATMITEKPLKPDLDSLSPVSHQRISDSETAGRCIARFTTAKVPACPSLQLAAAVPLACMLQPFAEREEGVPLAFGLEEGLFRCSNCKSFVNPHFYWFDHKVRCNLCLSLTDVPLSYFGSPTDSGARTDKYFRAELRSGSYDFMPPSSSSTSPPVLVFAIDSSYYSLRSNFFRKTITTIRDSLESLPLESEIAILLFNTEEVVFVRFDLGAAATLIVMRDIQDPFLPGHASIFFVSPHLMKEQINEFIDTLLLWPVPPMTNSVVVCASATLQLSYEIVGLKEGGSVLFFLAAKADLLEIKDSSNRIALDVFVDDFEIDFDRNIQTIAPNTICGLLLLKKRLTCEKFFNCIVKLRASKGLTVLNDTIVVSRLDPESVLSFEFSVGENLDPNLPVFFQLACIYTRTDGVRLVRIHNMAVSATRQLNSVFKHCDSDAVMAHMTKKYAREFLLGHKKRAQIREQAIKTLVGILFAYRSNCAVGTHSGQLILPDSLKTMPLMVLAFLKSFDRLHRILACQTNEISHLLVPRIYEIDDEIKQIPASRTKIDLDKTYLFDCLDEIILLNRSTVPEQFSNRPVVIASKHEPKISHLLIEDSGGDEPCYIDWLCLIHRLIQEKIN